MITAGGKKSFANFISFSSVIINSFNYKSYRLLFLFIYSKKV